MALALLPPAPPAGVSTSSRAAESTRTRAGKYVAARVAGKIAENPVGCPAASPSPDDAVAKSIACGARTAGPVSARGSSSRRASAEHARAASPAKQPSRATPRLPSRATRPRAQTHMRAPKRATAPGVYPQPSSPSWAPRAPPGRRPLLTQKNLVTAEMRCQLKGVDGAAGRSEGRARVVERAGRIVALASGRLPSLAAHRTCGEGTWLMARQHVTERGREQVVPGTTLLGGRQYDVVTSARHEVPPSVASNVSGRGPHAATPHARGEPKRHKNSERVRQPYAFQLRRNVRQWWGSAYVSSKSRVAYPPGRRSPAPRVDSSS